MSSPPTPPDRPAIHQMFRCEESSTGAASAVESELSPGTEPGVRNSGTRGGAWPPQETGIIHGTGRL
jgi:hypothetical protein